MTVVVVSDTLDVLGVAKDYPSAIDFLIAAGWLTPNMVYYDPEDVWRKGQARPLDILFGKNWINRLKSMDLEEGRDFFEFCAVSEQDIFNFTEANVFGD